MPRAKCKRRRWDRRHIGAGKSAIPRVYGGPSGERATVTSSQPLPRRTGIPKNGITGAAAATLAMVRRVLKPW